MEIVRGSVRGRIKNLVKIIKYVIYIPISYFSSDRKGSGLRVHLSPVAGGRAVSGTGEARAAFAAHARALAYDCELDAVLDSVIGNRKDCFVSIRGKE